MAMQMKDSGIEWIGEIPADWEVRRLKYVGEAFIGLTYSPEDITDESGLLVLRSSNVQDNKIVFDDNVYVSKSVSSQLLVQQGDILLCSRNGSSSLIGKSAIIDEQSAGNTFGAFMTIFRSKHNKFLKHVFNSPLFKNQSGLFLTTTINQLTNAILYNIVVVMPPEDQQQKIAAYLDSRCAEIDAVIAAKQRQNELLKEQRQSIIFEAVTKGLDPTVTYKDSGVEWIGEISAGWNAFKIKHIVAVPVTDGPHESPQLVDEGIPFISAEAVKGNKLDFSLMRGYISKEDHEVYCKKVRPQREDIFVVKSGATTGAIAIVDTDEEFSIWSPLAMVRSKKPEYIQRFVYYAMLSDSFRKQIELGWNFGTQQNLGMNVLENLYIACPLSTSVQQQIADYLDIRCAELDRVVAANNAVIDKLKEYRQSLIYEAVTGKIAV